jgi:hypothetical protein
MKKKMTTFVFPTEAGYNITVEHHTEEQAKEVIANLNKPK